MVVGLTITASARQIATGRRTFCTPRATRIGGAVRNTLMTLALLLNADSARKSGSRLCSGWRVRSDILPCLPAGRGAKTCDRYTGETLSWCVMVSFSTSSQKGRRRTDSLLFVTPLQQHSEYRLPHALTGSVCCPLGSLPRLDLLLAFARLRYARIVTLLPICTLFWSYFSQMANQSCWRRSGKDPYAGENRSCTRRYAIV